MALRLAPVILSFSFIVTLFFRFSSAEFAGMNIERFLSKVLQPELKTRFDAQTLKAAFNSSTVDCQYQLGKILMNPTLLTQYLDALGKPGSGLLVGNQIMLGSYQECQQLPESQFCTASYIVTIPSANKSLTPVIGMCTPQQCLQKDITNVISYLLKAGNLSDYAKPNLAFEVAYGSSVVCMPMKQQITTGAGVTIFICFLFILMALIGTIVELIIPQDLIKMKKQHAFQPIQPERPNDAEREEHNHTPNSHIEIVDTAADTPNGPTSMLVGVQSERTSNWALDFLLCFSATKNASTILATKSPKGAIGCINGIRTLSMWWVILGHTFAFTIVLNDNTLFEFNILHRFTFLPIANGPFSVDSFFFLSGLLVSYLTLRRVSAKGKFPWVQYYLHRFLRLTPSYMFVILFTIYIYPLMGEGPTWFMQRLTSDTCKKSWWTNLLYINNFYPTDAAMCIGWSWYLANDMQFYIISPIIILLMARFKTIGAFVSCGVILIASFISTIVIIDYYGLISDMASLPAILNTKLSGMFMKYVYIKPYCRISPYIVGLFLGFVLFKKFAPRRAIKVPFIVIGWCIGAAIGMATIWGNWHDYKVGGEPMTHVGSIFYGTFSRFSWGCFLAWLVFACHSGFGGLLNKFLSWKAFIPTSRLTYSAYLLHPLVIYLYVSSNQSAMHYTDLGIAYMFCSFLTLSYASAFILALFVEYPLMNVEQLIFKRS